MEKFGLVSRQPEKKPLSCDMGDWSVIFEMSC